MNLEKGRAALLREKTVVREPTQGSGMLLELAKEYYTEIRELRTPPRLVPWRRIAESSRMPRG